MITRRSLLRLGCLGLASVAYELRNAEQSPSGAEAAPSKTDDWADDFPSDVASAWFELLYDVVKAEKPLRHRPRESMGSQVWLCTRP